MWVMKACPFYCWMMFHCIDVAQCIHLVHVGHLGPNTGNIFLPITNKTAMNLLIQRFFFTLGKNSRLEFLDPIAW